jgi:hypothetical protein
MKPEFLLLQVHYFSADKSGRMPGLLDGSDDVFSTSDIQFLYRQNILGKIGRRGGMDPTICRSKASLNKMKIGIFFIKA